VCDKGVLYYTSLQAYLSLHFRLNTDKIQAIWSHFALVILLLEGNYIYVDRGLIAYNGPPKISSSFPYDNKVCMFSLPDNLFTKYCLTVRQFLETDWIV